MLIQTYDCSHWLFLLINFHYFIRIIGFSMSNRSILYEDQIVGVCFGAALFAMFIWLENRNRNMHLYALN